MLKKGFDMPYYLDQLIISTNHIHPYTGEAWAPKNTTHFIEESDDSCWCFEVEGRRIYCLGLFDRSMECREAAPRNDFHDVTEYLKNAFFK